MTYDYDPAGDMRRRAPVERAEVAMRRDPFLQLVAYGDVEYQYDHAGRRVIKRAPGSTTYYFYDGDTLIGERTEGLTARRTAWAMGPAGRMVQWTEEAGTGRYEYLLNDPHGTTTRVLDETGEVESEVEYEAFGAPIRGEAERHLYAEKVRDEESL
jgi:hypothetical protein